MSRDGYVQRGVTVPEVDEYIQVVGTHPLDMGPGIPTPATDAKGWQVNGTHPTRMLSCLITDYILKINK